MTRSAASGTDGPPTMTVAGLRSDDLVEPLGVDGTAPMLSWMITSDSHGAAQTAYQVRASSTSSALDSPDRWDTGKVVGTASSVEYGGDALTSRSRVFWQVRVWDRLDAATAWSAARCFEIGLLDPDEWKGDWITDPAWAQAGASTRADPAAAPVDAALPLLSTEFVVDGGKVVESARLYIAGLGSYSASVNGRAVSDDVLTPGYTAFHERVEYSTYDVQQLLHPGANAVGIELGTGPALIADDGGYVKYTTSISHPKAIAQVEVRYADGSILTVATDSSWRSTTGPTTVSNWFSGERYDARLAVPGWDRAGTDRGRWNDAVVLGGAAPVLSGRIAPPLRVMATLAAADPVTLSPSVVRYDLSENIAGLMELTVDGPAGSEVQLWPGERLNGDGTVDQEVIGTPVFNSVTTDGGSTTWRTRFRYDGFRHIEVRGLTPEVTISGVSGLAVRVSNDRAGSFSSSDPRIDAVHRMIDRAVQGNMYSVLTDCPHREKLGWLEETHLVFGTIMRTYDVAAYARSLVRTIAEAQLPSGQVPSIAPEYPVFGGGFRDDPNWGGALILLPWSMYRNYGDIQTLRRYYSSMEGYLRYLDTRRHGSTQTYGDDALGDWAELGVTTDPQLVTTFGYYRAVEAMAGIADVLGISDDAARYADKRDAIRADTITRWYDSETNVVANGTQAAYAVALDMDAVPEADREIVVGKLVDAIAREGDHLNVGEIALPSVYRVLARYGQDELIFRTVTQTTQPSYGAFVEAGMTSLPEYWDMQGSLNHFMLGAVDEWFSSRLAGITQTEESVAFEHLVFKPTVVGGMTSAESSYRTRYGQVASRWELIDQKVRMTVTVPVGSTAVVHLPLLAGTDGAEPVSPSDAVYDGVTTVEDGAYATFRVGSGTWSFGEGRNIQATPES